MARTVTIGELKTRCRYRADMENTTFVSDTELLSYINEAYAMLYDTLVSVFQNYYSASTTFSVTSATNSYSLPADFYKLIGVDQLNGSVYTTIFPYNEMERNSTISVTSSIPTATVRMRYIPAPTVFTTDNQTIDGVAGWEALLVTDVAIMMLDKEESDTSTLERRRQREYARVLQMAQNRDITIPGRVTDVTVYDAGYIAPEMRYRFYGSNIEFISVQFIGI